MYILQAQLGILKYNSLQRGKINAALRLGTSLTTQSTCLNEATSQVDLGIKLNLKLDNLNQMQRCSITLSLEDDRVLGVASISLSRTKNEISTSSKLIQCADKKAELCLKLKVDQVHEQLEQNERSLKQLSRMIQNGNISPIKHRESVNNIRNNSKIKSAKIESSQHIIQPHNFNNTEVKANVKSKKVPSEEQVNKLKEQKSIYYQLYKIQKTKNQVAYKFISSLISKLTNQYPQLLYYFIEPNFNPLKSKMSGNASPRKNQQSQMIKQLEQANRSLHRHLDECKKANKQLKEELLKSSNNTKSEAYEDFNQIVSLPSFYYQKSERIKSPSKSSSLISPLQGIDLKRVLQESIIQRNKLSELLKQYPRAQQKQSLVDKAKLRLKINKAFLALLQKNTFNRQSIIIHKKEIIKIIDQCLI